MSRKTNIEILKENMALELFLKAADQTYVVARWCYLNKLFYDFYWNAAHALEKYLKAALLLNGRSSVKDPEGNSFGHNIVKLYAVVCTFSGEIIPMHLQQPSKLKNMYWLEETTEQFVLHLSREGDANNRYKLFGLRQRPEDIYKLDMLVFAIRRLIQNLDAPFPPFSQKELDEPKLTNYEFTVEHPRIQPTSLNSSMKNLTGDTATEAVRQAFFLSNLAFAPNDFDHDKLINYSSSENPALYLRIFSIVENERCSNNQISDALELIDWAIENIQFPKSISMKLKTARKQLSLRLKN